MTWRPAHEHWDSMHRDEYGDSVCYTYQGRSVWIYYWDNELRWRYIDSGAADPNKSELRGICKAWNLTQFSADLLEYEL